MTAVVTPQTESSRPAPAPTADAPTSSNERRPRRRKSGHKASHTLAVLAIGVALWLYIGIVPIHLMHNTALLPGWMLLGAALIPATVLWAMSHRLQPADTISAAKLVQTAMIGGFFSFAVGGTLDAVTELIPQETLFGHGSATLALAGFVEEFAKGAMIVVLGWGVAKTARNGLFLGGAVGIGFAILESMYYILARYEGASPVLSAAGATLERNLTAPLLHMTLSALLGAAIFAAAGSSRFRLTLGVIGAYVGVAVIHGIYDGGGDIVAILTNSLAIGGVSDIVLMPAAMLTGVLVWRHVARRNRLQPAPSEQQQTEQQSPTEAAPTA
jgi:protease PrsW